MGQRYRIRHEGEVSKVHGIGDESGPATVGSAHVGCGEDQFDFELNIGTVLSHSDDTATVKQCFFQPWIYPGKMALCSRQ